MTTKDDLLKYYLEIEDKIQTLKGYNEYMRKELIRLANEIISANNKEVNNGHFNNS